MATTSGFTALDPSQQSTVDSLLNALNAGIGDPLLESLYRNKLAIYTGMNIPAPTGGSYNPETQTVSEPSQTYSASNPGVTSNMGLPPGYDPAVYAPVRQPPGGWTEDPLYNSLWYDKQYGATIPATPAYTAPPNGTSFADLVGTLTTPAVNPPATGGVDFGPLPPPGYVSPPPATGGGTYTPPPATGGGTYTPPPYTPPPSGGTTAPPGFGVQPVSSMNATPYAQMLNPTFQPATARGNPTSNLYGMIQQARNTGDPYYMGQYQSGFQSILNAPKQMPQYQFQPIAPLAQTAQTNASIIKAQQPQPQYDANGNLITVA